MDRFPTQTIARLCFSRDARFLCYLSFTTEKGKMEQQLLQITQARDLRILGLLLRDNRQGRKV